MISIIMALYNAEKYLKIAIESVICQECKDWELLIINDGSTDNSAQILNQYKDPRIKYFFQQRLGVSLARNLGLNNMSGEYFCFLDADDYFPANSLSVRLKKLVQNPDIDFLDGNVQIFDSGLERLLKQWSPSYKGNPFDELLRISDSCFFGQTWMIRRKHTKTYRFHEDITHGEDLLFFIELASEGGYYDFVDDVILHYRSGHSSAMSDLEGLEASYHKIYRFLQNQQYSLPEKTEEFRKKARSIIFKSYAGNFQLKNALLSLSRKW